MDSTTLQAEIDATKSILSAVSAAILALADPTITTYRLDTGQGQQTVTRNDLPDLLQSREALQSSLCMLEARQTGSNAVHVVPGW